VRGAGLIAGLEVTVDALAVVNAALERGLVINRTSGTVIRLLPAYIITPADVDEATDILDQAIGAVAR
jgi:acetylornithine/N-succinyldiaminopimelate aminotransferase